MFVCMGEWGWQGYNLLQTACGQRQGGRDSDTEREQGKERRRGQWGKEKVPEKEWRKGERTEWEVAVVEWRGIVFFYEKLLLPLRALSSLLSHLLSCQTLWALEKKLISLTFMLLSLPCSDASLTAATGTIHEEPGGMERWWMTPVMDHPWTLTGAHLVKGRFSEPRSCRLFHSQQYHPETNRWVWAVEY